MVTRVAGVSLLLGLWLTTVGLVLSPQLHRWLHQDAQSDRHECLVIQFAKSLILVGGIAAVILATRPGGFGPCYFAVLVPQRAPDYLLAPSRAPPVFIPNRKAAAQRGY